MKSSNCVSLIPAASPIPNALPLRGPAARRSPPTRAQHEVYCPKNMSSATGSSRGPPRRSQTPARCPGQAGGRRQSPGKGRATTAGATIVSTSIPYLPGPNDAPLPQRNRRRLRTAQIYAQAASPGRTQRYSVAGWSAQLFRHPGKRRRRSAPLVLRSAWTIRANTWPLPQEQCICVP